MVRKVMARMLESLGYRVTSCATGEAAVEHYRKQRDGGQPYHAVIMDLTVPGGMGGKDAAREILAMDPEARLVVSSGYYDDPVLSDYAEFGFRDILPKPYKIAELEKVLGRLRSAA
jgi:two-component system, cell cycle sensor histidine kinase and response regulator CckA